MKVSNWKRADHVGNIFQDFVAILVFKIGAVSFKILRLSTEYWSEEPFLTYQMLDFLFESVYDLILLLTLYKWSCGVFGYDSDTRERLVLKPHFRKCLTVMTARFFVFSAFGAYGSFSSYMKWTIPFFHALNFVAFSIALFIVYKNSKEAEKRFPARNFAKIYCYSRLGLLILPFLVPCFSFWLEIVYMVMRILTANNVNGNPGIAYSIIRNLDQFLMVIVLWVLFCILKWHKVDGTGFDNEVKHD
jgi:lipoprotein signal peptidase